MNDVTKQIEYKPEENVTEIHSSPGPEVPDYYNVPVGAIITRYEMVRNGEVSFVEFWKARRNYNIALKQRLKNGPNSTVMLNLSTMSVVTERERFIREAESLAPIEQVRVRKTRKKRLGKQRGLRYAAK